MLKINLIINRQKLLRYNLVILMSKSKTGLQLIRK